MTKKNNQVDPTPAQERPHIQNPLSGSGDSNPKLSIGNSLLFAALKAELVKFYFHKMHIRILFINSLILFLLIGLGLQFSGSSDGGYSMKEHSGILTIHLTYSKIIYFFVITISICSHFGKEFEWKAIHQFVIKGMNSSTMILSKTLAYFLHFFSQYVIFTLVILLGFFLFSPVSGRETFYAVSWIEILAVPLGIFLAVSVSILAVSLTFSSNQSLVFAFLYYVLFEMVFRGILSLINSLSPRDYLDTIITYFPYNTYSSINTETPDLHIYILLNVLYIGIFIGLSMGILNKKEFALVNT